MDKPSDKWLNLFKLLPGYDPVATAEGAHFDEKTADLMVRFFAEYLTHIEGEKAGAALILEPWQAAFVGCIFGWKRPNGLRRYREAFLYVPRKNGKSTLCGGIVNAVAFCDNEPGAQLYSAAAEREQAALVYRQAKGMILNNAEMTSQVKIYTTYKSIEYPGGCVYKALSADADTKHGFNTHLAIVDELHAQPNRDLVDVLVTSTGARRQPLIIYITTADFDRESICNEKHDYACKVRDGIIQDSGFLPAIYEAEAKDDWKAPETWRKANPNLGISISLEYLERECKRAQDQPTYENTFKRLHLNMKTEQDVRVIPMDAFDACAEDFDPESLRGKTCFGGLDLASTEDLASFTLAFPCEEDILRILTWSWCPEDRVRDRAKKRVPYDQWAKGGFLTATHGNQIDYHVIRKHIVGLRDTSGFEIREISFDGWNAAQMVQDLQDTDGFALVKLPQTFPMLSAPTKEFLRRIKSHRLRYRPNPLYRWSASNMAVAFNGRVEMGADLDDLMDKVPIMPSKKHSYGKIDPIASTVDAIKSLIAHPEDFGSSVYETRGILTL